MGWISAEEALSRLGTKPQTLYANVSRGRIDARPDPADPRRSLYRLEDVTRQAERHAGRRKAEVVAADAISWGDPVLPSAISTIEGGRLFYRGRDAVRLADTADFEDIVALLWEATRQMLAPSPATPRAADPALQAAFVALAQRAADDLPSLGRSKAALVAEAWTVLSVLAGAIAPSKQDLPLHMRLAVSWNRPDAADHLRRALVLLADHELNASAFSTRVCASSGASLSACILSGLATLTGPRHGGAWRGVSALIDAARVTGAQDAVRRALEQGASLAAFGHRLYPHGDPRAKALLGHFPMPPLHGQLQRAGEEMLGEAVNVDFALSALAGAYDLPADAPLVVFALARCAGWLAHAMEQAESGQLIRPRARYCGVPPENAQD